MAKIYTRVGDGGETALFGGGRTSGNIALSALPNDHRSASELGRLRTRDLPAVDHFLAQYDRPGVGVFFGPAPLKLRQKPPKAGPA